MESFKKHSILHRALKKFGRNVEHWKSLEGVGKRPGRSMKNHKQDEVADRKDKKHRREIRSDHFGDLFRKNDNLFNRLDASSLTADSVR